MAPRHGCGRTEAHLPQDLALRQHAAFFHNLAGGGLDAETDGFFVNVESDIVKAVHRVLRVSFLSWRFLRQSQHRSRFENPSSFHLCIHTDGAGTIIFSRCGNAAILHSKFRSPSAPTPILSDTFSPAARFARVVMADVAHPVTQRGNARQVILSSDRDGGCSRRYRGQELQSAQDGEVRAGTFVRTDVPVGTLHIVCSSRNTSHVLREHCGNLGKPP